MKNKFKITALAMASLGTAGAQGLFDMAPNDEGQESLPLRFGASAQLGYDDNVNPLSGADDSSTYLSAYLNGSFFNHTPQTTIDVYGQIGYVHYLDDLMGSDDDSSIQGRLGVNWAHRVSERLRLSSRNFIAYEREPDYSLGFAGGQRSGEYLWYQTDNAVGYRWTERFGTYTGVSYSSLQYDDIQGQDTDTFTFYNQFRYQLNQRSILTFDYRFSDVSRDTITDSQNHYALLGIEHRLSPQSVLIARAGAQFRDVDQGENRTAPFLEAAIRSQVNESLRVRGFLRYGVEDYLRRLDGVAYSGSSSLRIGVAADYAVSRQLSFNAGVNYIMTNYEDAQFDNAPDIDEDLLNLNVGLTYGFTDNLFMTASYNFSTFSSDINGRDYDRNRFNVGVNMNF